MPKPSVSTSPGSSSLFISSVKGRIVAGFALLCLIFAVAAAASTRQELVHRSDLRQLDRHSTTATRLQEAEAQAGIAALLLQRYVDAGEESYVLEVRQHATATVNSLTEAVAQGAPPGVDQIATQGLQLVQGAGSI